MKRVSMIAVVIAFTLALTPLSTDASTQDKASARANDFATINREGVDAKKEEIRQRIELKKQERTEQLTGKRLETCKKRKAKINNIIAKRITINEKHLSTFDKVRDNLDAFVSRQKLDITPHQQLIDAMDTKRTVAVDSIDALRSQIFDCNVTAASNPGGVVKEVDKLARDALKDYRTAVREYAEAVKKVANHMRSPHQTEEAIQ